MKSKILVGFLGVAMMKLATGSPVPDPEGYLIEEVSYSKLRVHSHNLATWYLGELESIKHLLFSSRVG